MGRSGALWERFEEFASAFQQHVGYRVRPGAGRGVVFLPGGTGRATGWFDQALRIDARRPVALVDLTADDTIDGQLRAITGVLDRVGIARADVVGTSLGGMLAHALARAAPERVDGLGLVSTGLYASDKRRELRRTRRLVSLLPDAVARRGACRRVADLLAGAPDADVWGQILTEAYVDGNAKSTLRRQQQLLLELAARSDELSAPTAMDRPVLLVRALDDELITVAEADRLAAAHRRVDRVDLPDGGHLLPCTRPAALGEILGAFLDR